MDNNPQGASRLRLKPVAPEPPAAPTAFPPPPRPLAPPREPKAGKGCLFYGCLTVGVVGLMVAALAVVGFLKFKEKVRHYTDDKPAAFKTATASPQQAAATQAKWQTFLQTVKDGAQPARLTISADEINALIAQTPGWKDRVRISFDGNQITGALSLPLNEVARAFESANPMFSEFARAVGQDRYLNGQATFKVSCESGVLIATLDALKVRGHELPAEIMGPLRQHNLAQELYKDPEKVEQLKRLKRINVQNGVLTIEALPKSKPAAP